MTILIEGESYPIDYLEGLFQSGQFYTPKGYEGVVRNVGYYHNPECHQLVFMLPKVFMREDGKSVFGLTPQQLQDFVGEESMSTAAQFQWVRNLSIYFYKSLAKFKQRFPESTLINYESAFQLKGVQKTFQYSYLDIVLSFVAYHKKYRHQILFKHIDSVHANPKKPKWEKTVRKGQPILVDNTAIYDRIRTKNKVVNQEEQLIVYYYSILHHLNEQYELGVRIDKIYPLIKGTRFNELRSRGLSKLKKIKYRYFSDSLKEMHTLCTLFFSLHDQARGKSKADFITVSNYNIIFEDMVDRLFSDDLVENVAVNGVDLSDLKYSPDGKIIDHIFDHRSLLDDSSIFYIGDSKYYKSGNHAGQNSRYKQFTYAKNVVQYNIDLLNEKKMPYKAGQRYRDELTEGYNITPNFFVYGYIDDPDNYELNDLQPNGEVISSYQFKYRLFDRDTLFVHQYKINFLFVLKAYSTYRSTSIADFRKSARDIFRSEFVDYFSKGKSGYSLFKLKAGYNLEEFVSAHFKALHGKVYCSTKGELLLAHHSDDEDTDLKQLLGCFEVLELV